MPASKPAVERLEQSLRDRAPVKTMSSKALAWELCQLSRMQRAAAALNDEAYFDKIHQNAHSANPELLSADNALWEKSMVVRPPTLELLAQRINLCRDELDSRRLTRHHTPGHA